MSTPVRTVNARASVAAAQHLLEREEVHYLVVEDDDRELIGVVCACNLAALFPDRPVMTACHHSPVFVGSQETLQHVRDVMEKCGVGSVLVIDDGALKGIVTCADLIEAGEWNRESWECLTCGSHHQLRANEDGSRFCAACLEQTRSSGVREYYFTLGGGD